MNAQFAECLHFVAFHLGLESISVVFLSGEDDRKHILAGGLELMLNTPTSRACKSSNFCRDCLGSCPFFLSDYAPLILLLCIC